MKIRARPFGRAEKFKTDFDLCTLFKVILTLGSCP